MTSLGVWLFSFILLTSSHKRLEGLEHHRLPTSVSPGPLSSTQADDLHTEGLRVTVWFQGSEGHGLTAPGSIGCAAAASQKAESAEEGDDHGQ